MKLTHWEPDLRTIDAWISDGEIDLQPNFQRGDIWPSPKKRKLIDTILRGWSIPPIHVVVTESGTLDVLDGQQRLTAIRDFMRDDFPVDGLVEPSDPYIKSLSGFHYSHLPATTRRAFDQYTLRVFKITDYKPEEPGELFYRLNQPLSLTAGEQRNALYGPARAQLKELVANFQRLENKKDSIGFSNARMSYDDVFAKLLFFLERGSLAVKATESSISDRFKTRRPFDSAIVDWTTKITEEFSDAREGASSVKLNKATLLSWFLYFARFKDEKSDREFLSRFETAKERFAHRARLDGYSDGRPELKGEEFVRLFIDRASLRVSDVSSVVYRDFALWAVHSINHFKLPYGLQNNLDLRSLTQPKSLTAHKTLEEMLDAKLDLQSWARL